MNTEKVVVQKDADGEFVVLAGNHYPVIGYAKVTDEQGQSVDSIPILDVPQISDYEWHLLCLKSRLEHPERYPDEDVPAVIKQINRYLWEHCPALVAPGVKAV